MTQLPTATPTAWCSPRPMGFGLPLVFLLFIPALLLLTGCEKPTGMQSNPLFISLHGSVQGGQHPISGSSLQLYAAGFDGFRLRRPPFAQSACPLQQRWQLLL